MGRRPSASPLAGVSIADLANELRLRQRALPGLLKSRSKLMTKVAKLDATIASLGGEVAQTGKRGRGRPSGSVKAAGKPVRRRRVGGARPKNEKSLPETMMEVMKGKTLGVQPIADAVLASGYKSGASNFRAMVAQMLSKHRKLFKKVSRGHYTSA